MSEALEKFKGDRKAIAEKSAQERRDNDAKRLDEVRAFLVGHAGDETIAAVKLYCEPDGRIFIDVPKHIPVGVKIIKKDDVETLSFEVLRGRGVKVFDHLGDALIAAEPMKMSGKKMVAPGHDVQTLLKRFHIPPPKCPLESPTSSSINSTSST